MKKIFYLSLFINLIFDTALFGQPDCTFTRFGSEACTFIMQTSKWYFVNWPKHGLISAGTILMQATEDQPFRETALHYPLRDVYSLTVSIVVLTAGIDRRDYAGLPDCFDIYNGTADRRIDVAGHIVPDALPSGGVAEARIEKVFRLRLYLFHLVKDAYYESKCRKC